MSDVEDHTYASIYDGDSGLEQRPAASEVAGPRRIPTGMEDYRRQEGVPRPATQLQPAGQGGGHQDSHYYQSLKGPGNSQTRTREPHSRMGEPQTRTGEPHSRNREPHSRTGENHTRTREPRTRTGEPHSRTGEPHSRIMEPQTRNTGVGTTTISQAARPMESPRRRKKCCRKVPWWGWILLVVLGLGGLGVAAFFMYRHLSATPQEGHLSSGPQDGTITPPLVTPGFLRAQSTCALFEFPVENFRLGPGADPTTQPLEVDTQEKCRAVCYGQDQPGVFVSGESCLGADFTNSKFRISTSPHSRVQEPGSVYFIFEYRCFESSTPGRYHKFFKKNNRRPLASPTSTMHQSTSQSVGECCDTCVGRPAEYGRCWSFTYNTVNKACVVYPVLTSPAVEVAPQTDLYIGDGDYFVTQCHDVFPRVSRGQADAASLLLQKPYPTLDLCRDRCLFNVEYRCYGFDYNSVARSCALHPDRTHRLVPRPGTVSYRANVTCYSTDCPEGTRFISTRDTTLSTSPLPPGVQVYTSYSCAHRCLTGNVTFMSPPCYGYVYDTRSRRCTLFRRYDEDVGQIGGHPGVDVYRRLFFCENSCRQSYRRTSNSASSGGLLQPLDINTLPRCADRCQSYQVGAGQTCYGFDLHRETKRCTLYTREEYELTPTDGVDNYRRETTCPLPY